MKIIGMVWQAEKYGVGKIVDICTELGVIPSFKIVNEARQNTSARLRGRDFAVAKEVGRNLPAIGAWTYITPYEPIGSAAMFVRAYQNCGADPGLFCLNAEIEFKSANNRYGFAAEEYVRSIMRFFPELKYFYLSTFAQPSLHGNFPYESFLNPNRNLIPGILSGQCYGSFPKRQIDEMRSTPWAVSPCLRLYHGDGRMDTDGINAEFIHMVDYCESLHIPVIWFWSMDAILQDRDKYKKALDYLRDKETNVSHSGAPITAPTVNPFRFNEKSPQVAILQDLINIRGYTPPLMIDGHYGPKTAKGFQAVFGPNLSSLFD